MSLIIRFSNYHYFSFAARTKNIENRPIINERGRLITRFSLTELKHLIDNRHALMPHFSTDAVQLPMSKLSAAIVQSITTNGSHSGASRTRSSLVPIARGHRMSSTGVGIGYQPLALPAIKNLPAIHDKENESDRTGNTGFGLTEKEIDERASNLYYLRYLTPLELSSIFRYPKL